MKIDKKLLEDIFSLKKKITKASDKKKLSKYEQIIPLYDIYSHLVYPVDFTEVEDKLLNKHYRFITKPQKKIIENYLKDVKKIKKRDKDIEEFKKKMDYNLKIIDNYDLNILEETSIRSFYLGSEKLGQAISVCRRKSFHPSLDHLRPYYTLKELIKMGQNNKLLKKSVSTIELQDEDLHFKICKDISYNDIKYGEILEHKKYLEKYYNEIVFFSIFGSYFVNQNLRYYEKEKSFLGVPFPQYLEYGDRMNKIFNSSPGLEDNYYLYRFIQDDSFLENLKVGDVFVEGGILSTTRNPFYSPDELKNFGMILLKISIPKKFDKLLLIEGLSAFPFEQEIIFPPFTRMKLISKDNDFNYYHTNENIEKKLKKRYHFEILGQDKYPDVPKFESKNIPEINIRSKLFSPTLETRKREFLANLTNKDNICNVNLGEKIIKFYVKPFDSTEAYERIFSQKDEYGLALYCFDDYSMKYGIEISNEIVFNYQNRFFPSELDLSEKEIIMLLGIFGNLFGQINTKFYFSYDKKGDIIYPKILENEKLYKNDMIREGFGFRDFVSNLNSEYKNENHLYFKTKYKTWKDYFENMIKENKSLNNFYDEWEKSFDYSLERNLFSLVNLQDFYNENNIILNEIKETDIESMDYNVRQRS